VSTNSCTADLVAGLVLMAVFSAVVVFGLMLLILLFAGFGV
jgi:hypothetical protein